LIDPAAACQLGFAHQVHLLMKLRLLVFVLQSLPSLPDALRYDFVEGVNRSEVVQFKIENATRAALGSVVTCMGHGGARSTDHRLRLVQTSIR